MTASARPAAPAGTPPAWAVSLLTGATMFILMDIVRMLFPSISFIYGRAGTTPAAEMGVFALLLFATSGLLARTAGINVFVATPAAITATLACRVALVATNGGTIQLLASSLGFVSVVALLGALAASDISVRHAARGLAIGLLFSLSVHTMLGTHDSIWIGGGIGWLVTALAGLALVYAWLQVRPTSERPDVRTILPWMLVGPIIAMQGIVAGTPGAMRSAWGESAVIASVILVLAAAGGYLGGRLITSSGAREFSGMILMVPSLLTAVFVYGLDQRGVAAIASALAAALATLALAVAGEVSDDSLASRSRRSAAPAGGMILAFLIIFGYYASFELAIGLPRGILPAASAGLIGLVLFRLQPTEDHDPAPRREDIGTVLFAPFLVLFVVMASQTSVSRARFDASVEDLRVMTWNVAMGYNDQGQFDPDTIVNVIASQGPEIVVLNEVDRGWLLAGGHDLLGIIADELQMHYAFGPAADALWGNAILSTHPISDVTVTTLGGDAPMNRVMLQATVTVAGEPLVIIGTHLHHIDEDDAIRAIQVQEVATAATNLQVAGTPYLILGDFNEEPDSAELAPMLSFTDLVAVSSNDDFVPTYPSTAPSIQIDHIFGPPGSTASDLVVPATTASDHLPVVVTVSINMPVALG